MSTRLLLPIAADNSAALRQWLRPLAPFLDNDAITEICINRPGEVFVETSSGWKEYRVELLSFDYCLKMATLMATFSKQKLDEEHGQISATLPGGERVQVVIPPACEAGTVSVTVRKPSALFLTLADFEARGMFAKVAENAGELSPLEHELLALKSARRYREFLSLAVKSRKTIVIAGRTGAGKTTFGKGIILEIPEDERIITIEDVREIVLPNHRNRVHLLYSKDGQGLSKATPRQLLQSCLRMKPDRILLAEIRGAEAFDFLVNVGSGHPGSITTVHAGSIREAFEMLMLRIKECPEGNALERQDIIHLLRCNVDIIVQFHVIDYQRRITEIYYEPGYKHQSVG